jgi:CRP-like cAMP-binding protein
VTLVTNQLIEGLGRTSKDRLLAICEPIELGFSEVLIECGATTRHVYFPLNGFVSMVSPLDGKPAIEVGLVGGEGMVGTQLLLGVETTPVQALVQGRGSAWRVSTADFKRELRQSPALTKRLHLYIHVCMLQLTSLAACLRYHEITPRLARWLLMMDDRSADDTLRVTHQFLAYMLGVRRVGITGAALELRQLGLISYRRGEILILNRRGLEAAACTCYASERKSYSTYLQ